MTDEQKKVGRRISGLRAALHNTEDFMERVVGILEQAEPDAAPEARDVRDDIRHALKRDERMATR